MLPRHTTFLVVAVVVLAGCTSFPTVSTSPASPSSPTASSPTPLETTFQKSTVDGDGKTTPGEMWFFLEKGVFGPKVNVTAMQRQGDRLLLTYESNSENQFQFNEEVFVVAILYAEYVNTTMYPAPVFRVTATETNTNQTLEYSIKRPWAKTYLRGEMSPTEYAKKIYEANGIPHTNSSGS